MTRGDLLYKWFWYAMALLPVWLAEDLVFSRFAILGVSPMLLPLAVAVVAVLEGSVGGAGFGLGAGLLWSASFSAGLPAILGLAAAGAVIGIAAQYGLKQNFSGCLICSAVLLGVIDLMRILRRLAGGAAPLASLLAVALPELFISLLFAGPVYLLFYKVWSKVGGTRLM